MANNVEPQSSLGGTVGGRIARLVADASAATTAKKVPAYAKVANQVIGEWFAIMDKEAQQAMFPLLQQVVEDPATPPEARPLLRALSFPTGQWQMAIARDVVGGVMSSSLGTLFSMILAQPAQNIIAGFPNQLLDPGTVASASIRGLTWSRSGNSEALRGGLSTDRLDVLRELNKTRPALSEVLAMRNRGIVSHDAAVRMLRLLGYDSGDTGPLLSLRHFVESPEVLAEMWNRSIVSDGEGRQLAALSGATAEQFDRLTELGGQPLGVQELGEARRRGFIDETRFRRGVVQGPLRNEWFDVLDKLLIRRMSTVDAADAVNQNFMTEPEGRTVARANGLDPDDFSILLDTAGLPPGVSFMQEALNRGVVTKRFFDQAFLESRTKNKYLDLLFDMRIRIVPQETMRLMYREGVTDREATVRNLQQHGFSARDAASLVELEDRRRITETRQLTRTQVESLYGQRMITRADATALLSSLGFDDFGVESILDLVDLSRTQKFVNALVTKIRSVYVKRHIDEIGASLLLDAAGMPAEGRDDLFVLWDLERTTVIRDLTPAQITAAFKDNLFTRDVALARLQGVGYSAEDAEVLIQLRVPGPGATAEGEGS